MQWYRTINTSMSKQPPRTKRKTSSYAEDDQKVVVADDCMNQLLTNLDLSDKKTTPRVVAIRHCFLSFRKMQQCIIRMLRNW